MKVKIELSGLPEIEGTIRELGELYDHGAGVPADIRSRVLRLCADGPSLAHVGPAVVCDGTIVIPVAPGPGLPGCLHALRRLRARG